MPLETAGLDDFNNLYCHADYCGKPRARSWRSVKRVLNSTAIDDRTAALQRNTLRLAAHFILLAAYYGCAFDLERDGRYLSYRDT
jgi:hypothetical protein